MLVILLLPQVTGLSPSSPGAGAEKAAVSSRVLFLPSGGLEEQSFESWSNATATNASSQEAGTGNVRPHQAFGCFFFF